MHRISVFWEYGEYLRETACEIESTKARNRYGVLACRLNADLTGRTIAD